MRITTLSLQLQLKSWEIPAFRAAMIELVGRDRILFHQHKDLENGEKGYVRSYPKIQYGVRRGKATIIGIDEGSYEIEKYLLPALPTQLYMLSAFRRIEGYELQNRLFEPEWSSKPVASGLHGWLALSKSNYELWKSSSDSEYRKTILSAALTGQLRVLGKGIGLPGYERAAAKVVRVDNQKRVEWHQTQLIRFDVGFETNLILPYGIGIGRVVAFGFGEHVSKTVYLGHCQRLTRRRSVALPEEHG